MSNFSSSESKMARRLNLPPSYLLIHRVTFGSIGVLCQLDATAPFRAIVDAVPRRVSPTRLIRDTGSRAARTGAHDHHSWSSLASMDRACSRAQVGQTQTRAAALVRARSSRSRSGTPVRPHIEQRHRGVRGRRHAHQATAHVPARRPPRSTLRRDTIRPPPRTAGA